MTVGAATLELVDGDAPADTITLTLSETSVTEGSLGTVWVSADMTPRARTEDTLVTPWVAGSGAVAFLGAQRSPAPAAVASVPR